MGGYRRGIGGGYRREGYRRGIGGAWEGFIGGAQEGRRRGIGVGYKRKI